MFIYAAILTGSLPVGFKHCYQPMTVLCFTCCRGCPDSAPTLYTGGGTDNMSFSFTGYQTLGNEV